MSVEHGHKNVVMLTRHEMRHFMEDDVIQADQRLFDQIKVDPEAPSIRITRSPFRLHRPDPPRGFRNVKTVGPFRNPGSGFVPEFLTIPRGHPPGFVGPAADRMHLFSKLVENSPLMVIPGAHPVARMVRALTHRFSEGVSNLMALEDFGGPGHDPMRA